MTQNTLLSLKCLLQGKSIEEFHKIKEHLGLKHNSEVVRKLVRDEYLRITEAQPEPIEAELEVPA